MTALHRLALGDDPATDAEIIDLLADDLRYLARECGKVGDTDWLPRLTRRLALKFHSGNEACLLELLDAVITAPDAEVDEPASRLCDAALNVQTAHLMRAPPVETLPRAYDFHPDQRG